MDAFVKFLLDYYIWILAVIGILIVTVIGFLVDSKQKRKKKEQMSLNNSTEEVKTVENLSNVNLQEQVPVERPVNVQDTTSVDNVLGGNGTYVNEPVKQEQISVTNSVSNDGLSLSAQTPQFAPRDVNIPVSQPQNNVVSTNVGQVVPPKPVNAVPINQMVQPTPVNVTSINPVVQPMPVNVTPVNQNGNMTQQPIYNQTQQSVISPSSVEQPVMIPQANVYSNMVQNPVSLGEQSNNVVVPNVQQGPLNTQTVDPSVVQPTMPLNSTESQVPSQLQSVNQVPNVGINFVTGEDSVNDDTWKL